jgi:hypothetical protein
MLTASPLLSAKPARSAMIQPKRIGRFLVADKFGYVQPDVAIDLVDNTWKPLVDFVSRALMKRQGIRSVYLRGSIPRGLAIEHVSDADFIYFSEVDFDSADADLEQVAKADFPFVQELKLFRLNRADFDKLHHPQRRPYFHMLLKTQSLFLAGDDVAKGIEPFKIGPDMVSHVFALANEFAKFPRLLSKLPSWLQDDQKKRMEQSLRQWISKRIVRSGFEVTMNRNDRFTRDLYLCYEEFAKCYPERASQMYQVLINCLTGEDNPMQYQELVTLLVHESSHLLAS